jgi:hypothetical protein
MGFAEYVNQEIKNVPVERVIANLEKRLAKAPGDYDLIFTIGRAYALAYAKATDKLEMSKDLDIPDLPEQVIGGVPTKGSAKGVLSPEKRKAYLKKAIEFYRKGISLKAKIHESRLRQEQLGLAWSLQQLGEKNEALKLYREVFDGAVADMKKQKKTNPTGYEYIGSEYLAAETSIYLQQLLDPIRDKKALEAVKKETPKNVVFKDDGTVIQTIDDEETKTPKKNKSDWSGLGIGEEKHRLITPVLIPLTTNSQLASLVDPKAKIAFDLDGSGVKKSWGWTKPTAGWLVYCPGGRASAVESGLSFFGSVTFWLFWRNGYEAMCSLDDNGDGELAGVELNDICVWNDSNSDGIVDDGEITPAKSWRIKALDCRRVEYKDGMPWIPNGVTLESGEVRPSYDWIVESSD